MKLFFLLSGTFLSLALLTQPAFAAEAQPTPTLDMSGLPQETQEFITKILNGGCLDQHISKTRSDGSVTKLDQKVGGGCTADQQSCLDQHIDKTHQGTHTTVDQTVCGDLLTATTGTPMPTTTTPTITATSTPTPEASQLPATGPGGLLAITVGGVLIAFLGRHYFRIS